jgi:molybdate transport repressor ModE-like protein
MNSILDARRLRVLREVARQGSLSQAATVLSYTPSAVSQQIATLEREVGASLVERGPRGAVLTDAGERLVRHAEEILDRLAAAEEEMRLMVGLELGRLRLGAFSTAGASLVPQAVVAFRNSHPNVEVTLAELDPEEAVAELASHDLDLALIYEFPGVEGPSLERLERFDLLDDPLYIVLPCAHRLASQRSVRLADLSQEHWIQGVRRGSTLAVLPAACRAAGFEPNVVFRTDDHMAVQGFVAAGLGIAVIPRLTLATARRDIVVRPLISEGDLLTRQVAAAMPIRVFQPPPARAMVEVLTAVCRELAAVAAARLEGRVS